MVGPVTLLEGLRGFASNMSPMWPKTAITSSARIRPAITPRPRKRSRGATATGAADGLIEGQVEAEVEVITSRVRHGTAVFVMAWPTVSVYRHVEP